MRSPLSKIIDVAAREYRATALTKAFFFGVFAFPVLVIGIITILVPLFDSPPKRLQGTVAVVDNAGADGPVAAALAEHFTPEKVRKAYDEKFEKLRADIEKSPIPMPPAQKDAAIKGIKKKLGEPPDVRIIRLDAAADIDAEKKHIVAELPKGREESTPDRRLALIVVGPDALAEKGDFQVYVGRGLDAELSSQLRDVTGRAIVDTRLRLAGMDAEKVRTLTARPEGKAVTLTEKGETKSNEALQLLLPFGFMMLLWIAVFSSGQYLLTTTIEEKSSRVMELLLSAVSPVQLMTGKIIGQALVGLTILSVYGAAAFITAQQFNVLSLLPLNMLPWLAVYFFVAYFLIGSMMAAIGSAVNEMREAQAFMGVAMLVLMIPFFLWNLIIRQPNSTFSTVASFIPPISPFVMVMRLGQTTEPIPMWQIVGSAAAGLVSVVIAVWAAAKIFRVGVLMYGKPPTPMELLKWLRYA